MTAPSRSTQFAKLHKVLKKYYKPYACNANRTVIEHLLFACCLEDAHHDTAEEAFAALVHTFFDWNEVRVTSISELSEVMASLPDPRAAANRIKRVLHAVFEATFNFDLEDRRKKNLGPTVTWLEKLDGTSRFTVAYVIQAALSGHSIPIDAGTLAVLRVLDIVTDKDVTAGVVPGIERAIPKSKGIEFGSLLHELGADYSANPYSPALREILLQIEPECTNRLPKRRVERPQPKAHEAARPEKSGKDAKTAASASGAKSKTSESAASKGHAKKKVTDVPELPKKKLAAPEASKKSASTEKHPPQGDAAKKRSATEGLAKRKPR